MGKKNKKAVVSRDEEEVENFNAEHDEEMAAVLAIRQEKEAALAKSSSEATTGSDAAVNKNTSKIAISQVLEQLPTSSLPFKETYQICEFDLTISDENDDLAREMAFYEHSLRAVKTGRQLLKDLGIPSIRPTDYFCEHVKSDQHMDKVKDRLILEEKKIEAFEARKQRDFDRKFAKKAGSRKKSNEKSSPKGENSKDSFSKSDRPSGVSSGVGQKRRYEDFQKNSDTQDRSDKSPVKSFKRRNMDKKYGFGGKDRKRAKLNDSKSLNDMTAFNPRGGKFVRRGGKNVGGKGKVSRPGKDIRNKARKARSQG